MDFINMSIANDNILKIFLNLSNIKTNDGLELSIDENKIEELNHEDYKGKRIFAIISDKYGNSEEIKVDIGVHVSTDICQDELILNTNILDNNITFLANPVEQIIVEKLMPIVKFGELSGRYKDVFDIYWLVTNKDISKDLLMLCLNRNIFRGINVSDLSSLIETLKEVFNSKIYSNGVEKSNNWLDIDTQTIFKSIIDYFENIEEKIEV